MISSFLSTLVDWAWGLPLIFLLIGGGLYLAAVSRMASLRGFFHALKLIRGKVPHARGCCTPPTGIASEPTM